MYEDSYTAADTHRTELLADAARQRLIRIATCCRASAWRRAISRLRSLNPVRPAACAC